jgi:zinc D-Ala-D-Ala carboxypeptidase
MNLYPIWSSDSNGPPGASPDPQAGRGAYAGAVSTLLQELGIPEDYGSSRGLDLQPEATELVTARILPDGREIRLTPDVAASWQAMSQAASRDRVTLVLISGFRSVAYQRQIIERKLARGETLDQILRVNAAPGYSEHHTGRAVDIGTPGSPPLEEEFENTEAFRWLQLHAPQFGFSLTYPRFNLHRIVYEPWHWLHRR